MIPPKEGQLFPSKRKFWKLLPKVARALDLDALAERAKGAVGPARRRAEAPVLPRALASEGRELAARPRERRSSEGGGFQGRGAKGSMCGG